MSEDRVMTPDLIDREQVRRIFAEMPEMQTQDGITFPYRVDRNTVLAVLDAAPRAATEPPTPADFDAMSPEEFDAYLVRNGTDARIKTALAEPVTEPLTRERLAAALHWYHCDAGTPTTHAGRHDREADAILDRLATSTSAPEPGS